MAKSRNRYEEDDDDDFDDRPRRRKKKASGGVNGKVIGLVMGGIARRWCRRGGRPHHEGQAEGFAPNARSGRNRLQGQEFVAWLRQSQ